MHYFELCASFTNLPFQNLTKLLAIVQEDGHKQTLLSQQQADSVRYLNELNTVGIFYPPCKVGFLIV